MTVRGIVTAIIVAAALACSSSPTQPSTSSGSFTVTDLTVGTGDLAGTGSIAEVAYTGWLYDTSRPEGKGQQFDSGTYTFAIGTGNAIAGWHLGIAGMRVGGQRRLIIPPDLAYGSSSNGIIPANATLIFDVRLVSVR